MRQQTHQNKPLNTLIGVCDCGEMWHPDESGVECPSCGRGVLVPAGRTSQEIGDRLHAAWGYCEADEEDADLELARAQLGHKTIETTMHYLDGGAVVEVDEEDAKP